jgi:hypothetical protein
MSCEPNAALVAKRLAHTAVKQGDDSIHGCVVGGLIGLVVSRTVAWLTRVFYGQTKRNLAKEKV